MSRKRRNLNVGGLCSKVCKTVQARLGPAFVNLVHTRMGTVDGRWSVLTALGRAAWELYA